VKLNAITVEDYKKHLAKRAKDAASHIGEVCDLLGKPQEIAPMSQGLAHEADPTVATVLAYARGHGTAFKQDRDALERLRSAVSLILWSEDSPQSTLDTHLGLEDMLALPILAAEAMRAIDLGQPVRTAFLAAAGGVVYQEINRLCRIGRLQKAPHAAKCITPSSAAAWLAQRSALSAPAPAPEKPKAPKRAAKVGKGAKR